MVSGPLSAFEWTLTNPSRHRHDASRLRLCPAHDLPEGVDGCDRTLRRFRCIPSRIRICRGVGPRACA